MSKDKRKATPTEMGEAISTFCKTYTNGKTNDDGTVTALRFSRTDDAEDYIHDIPSEPLMAMYVAMTTAYIAMLTVTGKDTENLTKATCAKMLDVLLSRHTKAGIEDLLETVASNYLQTFPSNMDMQVYDMESFLKLAEQMGLNLPDTNGFMG